MQQSVSDLDPPPAAANVNKMCQPVPLSPCHLVTLSPCHQANQTIHWPYHLLILVIEMAYCSNCTGIKENHINRALWAGGCLSLLPTFETFFYLFFSDLASH